MADKSNFTPDEWKLLLESVTMAGIAVTAADPSGLWGLLKESFAEGSPLVQAKMDPRRTRLSRRSLPISKPLKGEGVARDGLKEEFAGGKPAEIKAKCIEVLRQAGAVVDARAPGDAAAFKSWLRQISQHVAEARGWISRHRRRAGERSGESNPHRNLECTEACP
jgi:hypothetical protein